SHDRFFLDKICDHLFIFEPGGNLRDWNGLYTEYRTKIREEGYGDSTASEKTSSAPAAPPKSGQAVKQSNSQASGSSQPAPTHMSQETRKAIRRVEGQLKKLEDAKTKLNEKFLDPSGLSPDEIADLGKQLNELNEQIEEKEMEWMELVG
ncbi:MAG: hypothetical protein AAF597_11835, partial [Bacteroidota bacterium]